MAKRKSEQEPRGNYRFLVIVAAALFFAFIINFFFYSNTRVVGSSMVPLLNDGDWLLVDRQAYRRTGPAYGDIVVLRKPDVTDQPIVKRVVGLPEDTLEICSGVLYRNEKPANDFVRMPQSESMKKLTVPAGCYFVMGDNRARSNDSRRWKNPFVRRDEITGKALFRYFPGFLNLRRTTR